MSIFAWKDSYSIGVPEIDEQHRRLYSIADELYAAMNSGKGKDVLGKVLQNLIHYTKSHFAAEEKLMQRCGYPHLVAHRAKHAEMTQAILQMQRDFQAGRVMLTIEVMQYLSNWLRQHIGGSDRQYVPFVAGKAVA